MVEAFNVQGWTLQTTDKYIAYYANNRKEGKLLAEGGINHCYDLANTSGKVVFIRYEDEILLQVHPVTYINSKTKEDKKIMTTTFKDTSKGSYGTNIVTINSCQEEVYDFMYNKTKEGFSVRLVQDKDDKYLVYTNQKKLYPNEKVNANDFIGTISGPQGPWRDSFLPGAFNYYEKLHFALDKDNYISQYEYNLRTYFGVLAHFLTDYYRVIYNGNICRLSVQDYNNVQLISDVA